MDSLGGEVVVCCGFCPACVITMVTSCLALLVHSLLPSLPLFLRPLSHYIPPFMFLSCFFVFFFIPPIIYLAPHPFWQRHRFSCRSPVCRLSAQSEDSHVEPRSHQKGGQAHDLRVPPTAARLWRHQSGVLPQTE